jgi:DNA primase
MQQDNLWLENKYVMLVSSRFRNFKKKTALKTVYNMSCPFCGDSEENKRRARAYIFPKKGVLKYFCHKCNKSDRFTYVLKEIDSQLWREMMKELLVNKNKTKPKSDVEEFAMKMKKPSFVKGTVLNELVKISALPIKHPAKQYIDGRKIPSKEHFKLFYCEKFKTFTNALLPGKFTHPEDDEARIIIPFLDEEKNLVGYQGRSLDPDAEIRYISIMLQEDAAKVYGLDTVDKTKTVYLTEGPFDAMFLPNSIAAAGGNLTATISLTKIPRRNIVVVYDNEPRNKHIVKQNKTAIEQGFRVVIWPEGLEYKDINQMILADYSQEFILKTIKENTFAGMEALLVLSQRKKCELDEGKRYARN